MREAQFHLLRYVLFAQNNLVCLALRVGLRVMLLIFLFLEKSMSVKATILKSRNNLCCWIKPEFREAFSRLRYKKKKSCWWLSTRLSCTRLGVRNRARESSYVTLSIPYVLSKFILDRTEIDEGKHSEETWT